MTFWKDKRILVTGATGLVGSWLVRELLDQGGYVVALIRDWDPHSELIRSGTVRRVSVVNGALEDYSALDRAINEHEVDTVFHLGAQTIVGTAYRSPLWTFEANIRGTYNLLEAARVHSNLVKRVVIASSDKAYGEAEVLPYTEDMSPQGRHPYDVSKSCTDLLAQTYYHTYGLPIVIARCGNIFGGGDLNWSRIVPGTIRCLLRGERPILRSDGTFTRDYIYVKDAISAYLCMAESLDREEIKGQAFNFGPQEPWSVLDLVAVLSRLMGHQNLIPLIENTAKAEIRDQYLCSDKARRMLSWKPMYNLEEGLTETIDWYTEFLRG